MADPPPTLGPMKHRLRYHPPTSNLAINQHGPFFSTFAPELWLIRMKSETERDLIRKVAYYPNDCCFISPRPRSSCGTHHVNHRTSCIAGPKYGYIKIVARFV